MLAQKEALDREIDLTKKQERSEAVKKVQTLMSEYGLTAADITMRNPAKPSTAAGKKVAAKYRNSSTGETWSGRGLQPKWLKAALAAGRKLGDFTV
ncbi:MAG: H-NS histone family protein [Pseudomonadota bacterium]|nr:H-NS histone family protein [Pseudomonadota bacterium]